jgi:hypothetical protein
MSMHEEQTLSGRLTIELRTPDGRIVSRRQHDNLITTAGKALVARIFSGEVTGKPELRIAIGSGAYDAKPDDKHLGEPRDEVVATTKQVTVVSEDGQQRALATVMRNLPAASATAARNCTRRESSSAFRIWSRCSTTA